MLKFCAVGLYMTLFYELGVVFLCDVSCYLMTEKFCPLVHSFGLATIKTVL